MAKTFHRRIVLFGSQFRELRWWSLGPINFGRTSWLWKHVKEAVFHFLMHKKQRNVNTGRGQRARYSCFGYSISDVLPPTKLVPPSFLQLSMISSYHESLRGLTYSLSQNHQQAVMSEDRLTDIPRNFH